MMYSCLGNSMDRGLWAWWATVHGVAEESDTTEQLNNNNNALRKAWITADPAWGGPRAATSI